MVIMEYRAFNYRAIDSQGVVIPVGRFTTLVGANNTGKTSLMMALIGGLYIITNNQQALSIMGSLLWTDDNRFQDPDEPDFNTLPSGVTIQIKLTEDEVDTLVHAESVWERPKVWVDTALIRSLLAEEGLFFTVNFGELGALSRDNQSWVGRLGPTQWLDRECTRTQWSSKHPNLTDPQLNLALDELLAKPDAWKWMYDYDVIYIEANRGGYPAQRTNTNWEHRYLVSYHAEQRPGELAQLIEALELPERRGDRGRFFEYLRIVAPDIQSVVNRTDSLGRHVYVAQGGHEQPLYRSGNGIANVLYLCARVLKVASKSRHIGGLIVVDEPESGLHPDLHRRLMKLAATIYKDYRIQWVMGTHSPYLLLETLSEADRVLMTRLVSGHTVPLEIESSDQLTMLYEAIGFYLPSVLSAQGVIFVEGASELEFLRHVLPKVGMDAEASRVVITPIGGNAIISHVEPNRLARLHPNMLVWLDSELKSPDDSLDRVRRKYRDSTALECWVDMGTRALENMYPAAAIQRAFECGGLPEFGPFSDLAEIRQAIIDAGAPRPDMATDKVNFARVVARVLTAEEAASLPIVECIRDWWPKSR